jgi:hypothetical protein
MDTRELKTYLDGYQPGTPVRIYSNTLGEERPIDWVDYDEVHNVILLRTF